MNASLNPFNPTESYRISSTAKIPILIHSYMKLHVDSENDDSSRKVRKCVSLFITMNR